MLTLTKKTRVLLYGDVSARDYRSRLLIKFLQSSNHYCVKHICPAYYQKNIRNSFLLKKVFHILCWFELLRQTAFTDVIYLLPMNVKLVKNCLLLATIFRKKIVVEMYISLYDTYVRDRKIAEVGSKKAKEWMKQDILALTKSDYIIHTSNQELIYWEKFLNIKINDEKISIAPVCNICPLVTKRSWMQDGVFRICWWGTFIPLHGIDNILQAIKILQKQKFLFTCNLFGVDNYSFPHFVEKVQSYQFQPNVSLRKDLSFPDGSLPQYLVENCDLALGIFGNTDKAYNAIPNKLIEALSMGIPTLTMNSPALKEFFNSETDFWTCEPTPESIAESIIRIADGEAYSVNWEQTRQKVLETFNVARYQAAVEQVLGKIELQQVR